MTNKEKAAPGATGAASDSNDHADNSNATRLPDMTSDMHRVGGGYSVQFFIRGGSIGGPISLNTEWSPDVPSPRDARRKVDWNRYRQARGLFFDEISKHVGGKVLCVELGGGGE